MQERIPSFTKLLVVPIFCMVTVLSLYTEAYPKTYTYTDDNGTVYFTDDPSYLKTVNKYKSTSQSHQGEKKQPIFSRLSSNVLKEQIFSSEIESASRRYGIDPQFVKAIIKAESNFNPYAVSHKGALGLMQLIPATAKRYSVGEPFDPEQNIEGGVRYLKKLFSLFNGNLKKVIAAYNAGESAVQKYNGSPPFKETQGFVKKVLSYYKEYKALSINNKIFTFTSKEGTVIFTDSPKGYFSFR